MTNNQRLEYIDAQIRELEFAIAVANDENKRSLKRALKRLEKRLDALI